MKKGYADPSKICYIKGKMKEI